jgi:hypothetical protein
MGVKRSTGICRLVQMLGTARRGDLLSRSFGRLHHLSSLLERGFIGSSSLNNRSSGSIPSLVFFVTENETKSKNFALVKDKKK